jgi:hypothetical protein
VGLSQSAGGSRSGCAVRHFHTLSFEFIDAEKGTAKIRLQIAAIEKEIAQARKNLKPFKSAGQNPNPLIAKLESEITADEVTIIELTARQFKNRAC